MRQELCRKDISKTAWWVTDGRSTAKERYSIHKFLTSACRRGGRYTYSCNPPFEVDIEENPLALVSYCIIPSNPSSSSSKSRGGDNKKLMINQNIQWPRVQGNVSRKSINFKTFSDPLCEPGTISITFLPHRKSHWAPAPRYRIAFEAVWMRPSSTYRNGRFKPQKTTFQLYMYTHHLLRNAPNSFF